MVVYDAVLFIIVVCLSFLVLLIIKCLPILLQVFIPRAWVSLLLLIYSNNIVFYKKIQFIKTTQFFIIIK